MNRTGEAQAVTPREDLDTKRFRKLLEGEKQRLEHELVELERLDRATTQSDETGETADYDQHPADAATTTFLRERDEALEHSMRQELDQVRVAMDRLEAGSYGSCARCGK